MEEKINSAFHQLGVLGLSKAECQVKTQTKRKKKKKGLSLGESLFFLFFTVKEAKLVWLFFFYSPQQILNMIGKKSEITRWSGDVNGCGNSRSFVLTFSKSLKVGRKAGVLALMQRPCM